MDAATNHNFSQHPQFGGYNNHVVNSGVMGDNNCNSSSNIIPMENTINNSSINNNYHYDAWGNVIRETSVQQQYFYGQQGNDEYLG